jgi:hypothetical protein
VKERRRGVKWKRKRERKEGRKEEGKWKERGKGKKGKEEEAKHGKTKVSDFSDIPCGGWAGNAGSGNRGRESRGKKGVEEGE